MYATLDHPDRTSCAPSQSPISSPMASPFAGPRSRSRVLGLIFVALSVAMIPWLFYLSLTLPGTGDAAHTCYAWVTLDSCEALALFGTGRLLLREDSRYALTAAAVTVLLSADAWFDITTAAPGADLTTAIAEAVGIEIPLATLCAVLALRVLRRRSPGAEAAGRIDES